jgi:hypothetical protein
MQFPAFKDHFKITSLFHKPEVCIGLNALCPMRFRQGRNYFTRVSMKLMIKLSWTALYNELKQFPGTDTCKPAWFMFCYQSKTNFITHVSPNVFG